MASLSPLERVAPTMDFHPGGDLKGTIQAIDARISRTKKTMKLIRTMLSNQDRMDWKQLEEYLDLNEQLRVLEMFKVEFGYKRRML